MALNSTTNKVYLANNGNGSLTVLDGSSNSVTQVPLFDPTSGGGGLSDVIVDAGTAANPRNLIYAPVDAGPTASPRDFVAVIDATPTL